MTRTSYRIGLIVPSSNVTMETEVPAMLRARGAIEEEVFTFHSSRMRMRRVSRSALAAMDRQSDRCAFELSDARVDVIGYACLVATMSMGAGYHRVSQARLHDVTVTNGASAPVVTSAGALVDGLTSLGAREVSLLAPYPEPLTRLVSDYLGEEGINVHDSISLNVPDNLEVAALDPLAPARLAKKLDVNGVDAVVLSACVQMPSLPSVAVTEEALGLPVVSASICTVFGLLKALGLSARVPDAGTLLSGAF